MWTVSLSINIYPSFTFSHAKKKKKEKRTTDFCDCAATPKKRTKKQVIVDMDETQTDVEEGIVRIYSCYFMIHYIIVIILCEEYLHKKAASKLFACSINPGIVN